MRTDNEQAHASWRNPIAGSCNEIGEVEGESQEHMNPASWRFPLFGIGSTRHKLLYVKGSKLLDALTLEPIREWQPEHETVTPSEYHVAIHDQEGEYIVGRTDCKEQADT